MRLRHKRNAFDAPISVYEVHLGSWMRNHEEGNRWFSYRELAPRLAAYVTVVENCGEGDAYPHADPKGDDGEKQKSGYIERKSDHAYDCAPLGTAWSLFRGN
jgi:hypothetical protein